MSLIAIAAFFAVLVFLKLLSVLSNSVSAGIGLNPVSYALKDFLKLKHTQINRISQTKKIFSTWLAKDQWLV